MKKLLLATLAISSLALVGCDQASDVASRNLSKAADNFEVERRIVFYNGITGGYMLTIEGKCALGNTDGTRKLSVTCKTGPDAFKKHYLGLSDNVTYFVEQVENKNVGTYQYRVIFRPSTILPDIELDAGLNKD